MSHEKSQPEKSIGEQSYQDFADRYAAYVETKPHNAYLERPATRSLVPPVAGLRVLDAGCGAGTNVTWLLDQGASVVGVDVTPRMVELTRQRVGTRAGVLRADLGQALPLASANFDVVLSCLVLHYLQDWLPVFQEFHRVLKPKGVLVFSTGHPLGDYLWVTRKKLTAGDYFATEYFEASWGGFGEPRPLIKSYRHSLAAMINPLLAAGFQLETLFEPQPTADFAEKEPNDYAKYMKEPTFICIRARA